jgi:alpha-tubulin suppressor-like RCC1 family protein
LCGKVKAIASGCAHSVAVMKSGELYCWGSNAYGQLGLGHKKNLVATKLEFTFTALVETVVCGADHTFALLRNDEVFCWGYNTHGELGLGDQTNRFVPTKMTFAFTAPVNFLACGGLHTFALLKNKDIFCWGKNDFGQLGLGNTTNVSLPTKFEFQFPSPVKALVCGMFHTIAHLINNEIFSWGRNDYGQLGLGGGGGGGGDKSIPTKIEFPFTASVKYVACGAYHTFAQLSTSEVYCWGGNTYGQLGVGDKEDKNTPTLLTFEFPAQVKHLVCGCYYTLALLQTNDVFSWGYNLEGQLGLGDNKNRTVPTQLRMNLLPSVSVSCIYSEHNYCDVDWTPETHVNFPTREVQTPIFRLFQLNALRQNPGYLPDLLTHEVCNYIAGGAN